MRVVLRQQRDTVRLLVHQTDGDYGELDEVVAQQYPCCDKSEGQPDLAVYLRVRGRIRVDGYHEGHVNYDEKHRRGHPEIVSRELRQSVQIRVLNTIFGASCTRVGYGGNRKTKCNNSCECSEDCRIQANKV